MANPKYASVVMDARTGKILFSRYADKQLRPASLTKMMTVYIAIQAVEDGEIDLDQYVRISDYAAKVAPVQIGYRKGQKVRFRDLIRAAAVKSANDAAAAIADAIGGSQKKFVARMNRTAKAMGMKNTKFMNTHGHHNKHQYSTARDMSILGRHMVYDYPEYYNLFSRISTTVGSTTVYNTNRKFLRSYRGADGIKTGYINASGFNLTASAERGNTRIIVTVFGGRNAASRNAHVKELMDKGFAMASKNVRLKRPNLPKVGFSRVTRVNTSVESAERRLRRPDQQDDKVADVILDAMNGSGQSVSTSETPRIEEFFQLDMTRPLRRPANETSTVALRSDGSEVLGVMVGTFSSKSHASNHLFKTALVASLSGARRTVRERNGRFDAMFEGLTRANANLACGRLKARDYACEIVSVR